MENKTTGLDTLIGGVVIVVVILGIFILKIGFTYYKDQKHLSYYDSIAKKLDPMPFELGRPLTEEEKNNSVVISNSDEVFNVLAYMIRKNNLQNDYLDNENIHRLYELYYSYINKIELNYHTDQFIKNEVNDSANRNAESFILKHAELGSKHKYLSGNVTIEFNDKNYDFKNKSLKVNAPGEIIKMDGVSVYLYGMTTKLGVAFFHYGGKVYPDFNYRSWLVNEELAKLIIESDVTLKGIAYYDINKSKIDMFHIGHSKTHYSSKTLQILGHCVHLDIYSKNNELILSTGCESLNRSALSLREQL